MAISLLQAIKNGDTNAARNLLLHKCYKNIDRQTDKRDGTALYWACCQGFLDIVHILLIQGADVNSRNSYSATPLHAAADRNYLDIVKLLIQFGADVDAQTFRGDTACHLAAYRGNAIVVHILVTNGMNLELCNIKQHSPLEEALNKGHKDIVNYLEAVLEIAYSNQGRVTGGISPTLSERYSGTPKLLNNSGCSAFGNEDELFVDCCDTNGQNDLSNDLSLTKISVISNVPLTFHNKF